MGLWAKSLRIFNSFCDNAQQSIRWHARVDARREALGAGVLYLVSDRAKALIKLAETGLECRSVPDLFPLIYELVKSYSLALGSRLRQARQAVSQAQEPRSQCQASHRSEAEVQQVQAFVEASAAEVTHWESVHSAYRHHRVWTVLHNFDCRAADGTTPDTWFFRRGFPDLFETVLSNVEDLPRPRQRSPIMALSG